MLAVDGPPAIGAGAGNIYRFVELHVAVNKQVVVTAAMAVVVTGAGLRAGIERVVGAGADLRRAAGAGVVAQMYAGRRIGDLHADPAAVKGRWSTATPVDGVVKEIKSNAGDRVNPGSVIMVIE